MHLTRQKFVFMLSRNREHPCLLGLPLRRASSPPSAAASRARTSANLSSSLVRLFWVAMATLAQVHPILSISLSSLVNCKDRRPCLPQPQNEGNSLRFVGPSALRGFSLARVHCINMSRSKLLQKPSSLEMGLSEVCGDRGQMSLLLAGNSSGVEISFFCAV